MSKLNQCFITFRLLWLFCHLFFCLQCGICLCSISVFEDPVDMSCGHEFCRACWEGFLNVKIQEGDAHNIFCPAYECYQLVPVHVIESVVSREMDQRYLQFDIKVKSACCCLWFYRGTAKRTPYLSFNLYRFNCCFCLFVFPLFSGFCREQSCHSMVSRSTMWAGGATNPTRPWWQWPPEFPPAAVPSCRLWQRSPLLLVQLMICCYCI